jgi:hypothetical protein
MMQLYQQPELILALPTAIDPTEMLKHAIACFAHSSESGAAEFTKLQSIMQSLHLLSASRPGDELVNVHHIMCSILLDHFKKQTCAAVEVCLFLFFL